MDLVAAALEDVESGFVLVAVAVVGRLRWQLDEVHLDGLGQEVLVAGAEAPPGTGFLAVTRVRNLGVVDDDGIIADAVNGQLLASELAKAVGL